MLERQHPTKDPTKDPRDHHLVDERAHRFLGLGELLERMVGRRDRRVLQPVLRENLLPGLAGAKRKALRMSLPSKLACFLTSFLAQRVGTFALVTLLWSRNQSPLAKPRLEHVADQLDKGIPSHSS